MVGIKWGRALLFILPLLLWTVCYGQEISLSVTLDSDTYETGKPITGTIEVTHDQQTQIDPILFMMKDQSIGAEILKQVRFSPDNPLTLSIYQFSVPGQTKAGAYLLPPISIKIGGKVYTSGPTSYQVNLVKTVSATSKLGEQTALKVDAQVVADPPIYPGQHVQFVYTYYYVGDIELTKEQLPLLDAKGFVKVGQKNIEDAEDSGVSIRRISQEGRAVKPGQYDFPASIIEGYGYLEDSMGNKTSKTLLKVEIPEQTVNISPFPKTLQPPSFNGAFGQLEFDVKMLNSAQINLGDKISLQMTVSGKTEDWAVIQMPELCCQPGFSGFFEFPDIPPQVQSQATSKIFKIDLRILSAEIKAIPPIQFSYFDPETRKYQAITSEAIKLKVIPPPLLKNQSQPSPQSSQLFENQVKNLNIAPNQPLAMKDLYNHFLATWWNLLWLPLVVVLIFLQKQLKQEMEVKKKIKKQKTSQELYEEAKRYSANSSQFILYLKQAFVTRLWENQLLSEPQLAPEDWPADQQVGQVRELLSQMEKNYYSPQQDPKTLSQLAHEAQILFNQLRKGL